MAIGAFGLLPKFISFAISHVKKYLLSNISRKHATTKLSFIFGKIHLNESEIRRFLFKNVTIETPRHTKRNHRFTPSAPRTAASPLCAPWCGPVALGRDAWPPPPVPPPSRLALFTPAGAPGPVAARYHGAWLFIPPAERLLHQGSCDRTVVVGRAMKKCTVRPYFPLSAHAPKHAESSAASHGNHETKIPPPRPSFCASSSLVSRRTLLLAACRSAEYAAKR